MIDGLKLVACFVVSLFRSTGRLEAEIVILRHQLNVLRRRMPSRTRLTLIDRLIFVWGGARESHATCVILFAR